ncbi:MAG: caspase family protein [Nitrospinales bacterium]
MVQLGHSDQTTSALFIPNSGYVASASLDGSVKIWESSTGREIKTLKESEIQKKVWIRKGREHEPNLTERLNALAVSPDGNYLVSGGIFGNVTIWDISTGSKIKSLRPIFRNKPINAIAFSGKGDKFVTGSENGIIRIWDFKSRSITNSYKKHSTQINSVAMDANGLFILSGDSDGSLLLWDVFSENIKVLQREAPEIRAIAISSEGRFALTGDSDSGLKLWDTSTGTEVREFQGHNGKINSVSFSPDNRQFVSGGENSGVIIWDVLAGKKVQSFSAKSRIVNSVQYSTDGGYILAGYADGSLAMWRIKTSSLVSLFRGNINTPSPVSFSNDDRYLLSGINDKALDLWDIGSGQLIKTFKWQKNGSRMQGLDRITSVGFSFDNLSATALSSNGERKSWNIDTGQGKDIPLSNFALKLQTNDHLADGRILSSSYGMTYAYIISPDISSTSTLGVHTTGVSAVRFSPDGKYALSAEQAGLIKIWNLSAFNRKYGELKGHVDAVTSICLTSDSRIIGSSSKDNTIRIWDRIDKNEIVKLISSKNGEWIVATPDGYYNTSPEGSNLIHWASINSKETYTFEQFESLFRKPEIIKARLSGNLNAGKPSPELTLPPSVEIVENEIFIETNKKTHKLFVNTSSVRVVKSVRAFNNGRPLKEIKIDAREQGISIDIPLMRGANRITIIAYDDRGFSSNPKYIDIICKNHSLPTPNLYILGIGVSDYPLLSEQWQLDFADTDAESLIDIFKDQKGKYFHEIESNLIINEKATSENIINALNNLSRLNQNDIAIIFLAGHGVMDAYGSFHFLTAEGNVTNPRQGGIDWTTLTSYIFKIKGRVILLVDACHSGSIVNETIVPNDELAKEFFSGQRGGVMVFSASKGRQYSYESPDIEDGAGVFTYAIKQGLSSKSNIADTNGNGFVEFMELVDYVKNYVDQETNGEQTPWLSRKELFGDLPIAVVSN